MKRLLHESDIFEIRKGGKHWNKFYYDPAGNTVCSDYLYNFWHIDKEIERVSFKVWTKEQPDSVRLERFGWVGWFVIEKDSYDSGEPVTLDIDRILDDIIKDNDLSEEVLYATCIVHEES